MPRLAVGLPWDPTKRKKDDIFRTNSGVDLLVFIFHRGIIYKHSYHYQLSSIVIIHVFLDFHLTRATGIICVSTLGV